MQEIKTDYENEKRQNILKTKSKEWEEKTSEVKNE
jgi:hypothetical protein